MSTDFYLQFLDKNKKGSRVTIVSEAIKLGTPQTGIPSELRGIAQSTTMSPTKERKNLGLAVVDIDSVKETIFEYSNGEDTDLNQPICVLGDPGMGKSAIILDTARRLCDTIYNGQREFVELTKVSSDVKKIRDVFANPGSYYIFMDIRMTVYEKYELKGIPFPSTINPGTMESLFESWMSILFLPDAAGMLFLDEVNQTSIDTQTALYGILHKDERTIGGRAIANKDGWSVHCAGNLPATGKGVQTVLAALQDRMNTVWLEITFPEWIKWASTAKSTTRRGLVRDLFHPLVIGHLTQSHQTLDDEQFKEVFIQASEMSKTTLNAPNPRNFVALSEALYSLDIIIVRKVKELNAKLESLQAEYDKLQDGTPEKAQAYEELQKIQKQYRLVTTNYAARCEHRAKMKINTSWALKFRRYVAAQNVNINDIFEYATDEEAKLPIFQKLTYKQDTGVDRKDARGNVVTGSTPQEVTNNMGQLKELIQSVVIQFTKSAGLEDYVEGKKKIPNPTMQKDKYQEFLASLPTGANKEINEDFKYVSRIYTIINTQIRENSKDLAAVTWSYLANATYNGILLFPLFKFALDKNCTPQQLKQLTDDRGKDISFNKAEMEAAMSSLNAKLKEDIQAFSTASAEEEEEGEGQGGPMSAPLEKINDLLEQSIAFLKK